MTTDLGIAAVTRVLQGMLERGLTDRDAAGLVGSSTVTALPPDRVTTGETESSQLNVYLRQVVQDPGLRNSELPVHRPDGSPQRRTLLTLDLHYLISAYTGAELHADVLLGMAAQVFHEQPLLVAATVREVLDAHGGDALRRRLAASGLAEQVQTITLTPDVLDTEELSRLWTAFQAPYRPSLGYTAHVLLVEGRRTARPSVPVRTWTTQVRAQRRPVISEVAARGGTSSTPIVAGVPVEIRGERLVDEDTVLMLDGVERRPTEASTSSLVLELPAETPAGLHLVQVVHRVVFPEPAAGVPVTGAESNVAALLYRPTITAVAVEDDRLTVDVAPAVSKPQRVAVLLTSVGAVPPRGHRLERAALGDEDPDSSAVVAVDVSGVSAGRYLVRVQVDGAESPLVDSDHDGAVDSPEVTLP